MRITKPETAEQSERGGAFQYYQTPSVSFSELTQAPDKSKIGEVTMHIEYLNERGVLLSQLLTLSPDEVAQFKRLVGA